MVRIVALRADAAGDRLGDAEELQGDLRDDAKRPFRADEKPSEIIASRRFLRAARGVDDFALRGDDFKRQHVVLHRAVAYRIGARGARRDHAADGGVGARVDGEEQSRVAQVLVQRLAGDAGLDHAIEILRMDRDNSVHLREVDADAAKGRVDMALQGCARAEGDYRDAMCCTEFDDCGDLVGILCEDDRIRRLVLAPGEGMGVLAPNSFVQAQSFAEALLQGLRDGGQRLRAGALRGVDDVFRHLGIHGVSRSLVRRL